MASGTFGKLGLIGSWLGEHCDCNAGMVRQVTAAEGEDLVLPALRLVWRIGGFEID
jgi:hypothetical protein